MARKIKLKNITIDGGTQPRNSIDEGIISEYAESLREGSKFPPITVFSDGVHNWLADGFHRYFANKKVGFIEIDADVIHGTRRDAILYSVSANSKHGLRRTNEDKRKAVLTLLNDEEWSGWSDREIARKCAVDNATVSKYRKTVSVEDQQIERKVKRGDQEYTVNTSNIGKKKQSTGADYDDLPDNVNPQTGEIYENTIPGSFRKERKGLGLQKAHEAISKLKEIPLDDDLLDEGYNTVIKWINDNR